MATVKTMCACGSGASYKECCEPYHDGSKSASTAITLMRSRYSAFINGKIDYLVETTLPAKRTANLKNQYHSTYESIRWVGLEVVGKSQGGPSDKTGKVEFKASYIEDGSIKIHHEYSRFRRKEGKWYYVDAVSEG